MSPTIESFLAGAVEGFYGRPWTPCQRGRLFQWLRDAGLNTYLYAPKDDLKHRALWREPYAEAEAAELRALVRKCQDAGIRFIYALAPGLDIECARESDWVALVAKMAQVQRWGCRDFALLWDDIPATLSDADRLTFRTPAAAQSAITNRFWNVHSADAGAGRLLFCPTIYCGRMAGGAVTADAYLGELGERLDPGVDVLWTGPEIISGQIPVESIRALQTVIRRKPVLWDNLHANDYDVRRLHLGPYAGRASALRSEVGGILLNPNCAFDANFVAIRTLGEYVNRGEEYRPREAYLRGIDAWMPSFVPKGRAWLKRDDLVLLGDLLYLPSELGDGAIEYLNDFEQLRRAPPDRWGIARPRFEETSRRIAAVFDRLTEIEDRDLLHALYPHAWEIKETALRLLAWVTWRREHPEPGARYRPLDAPPELHRGGFISRMERLLPLHDPDLPESP